MQFILCHFLRSYDINNAILLKSGYHVVFDFSEDFLNYGIMNVKNSDVTEVDLHCPVNH